LINGLHSPGLWLPGTYLARLDPEPREALLKLGTLREIPAKTRLIQQGMRSSDLYLLRAAGAKGSACVKISAAVGDEPETLLAIRIAGDLVGEGAMFRADDIRSATVTACVAIRYQSISRDVFRRFLDSYSQANFALTAQTQVRLGFANRRRLDFRTCNVKERLARIILELLEAHGEPVGDGMKLGVQLSQEELGDLIGASPSSAHSALVELRAEGLVQRQMHRGVFVPNMIALRVTARLN
jgi:CRP/FNR family transcriptional regulator, cyclic AMP receptor protein